MCHFFFYWRFGEQFSGEKNVFDEETLGSCEYLNTFWVYIESNLLLQKGFFFLKRQNEVLWVRTGMSFKGLQWDFTKGSNQN